jgi:predicted O-methyltransferase YrrM
MWLTKHRRLRQFNGVLETANWLFLKLLFKNPSGSRTYPGLVFRDYMSLVKNEHWPSRSIFEVCGGLSHERIQIEHLPGDGIATSIAELAYMAMICRALKPKKIFEIGTFRGRTALNFALNSPDDCTIYTMDLPPQERLPGLRDMHAADAQIVTQSITGADYQGKDVAYKIRQIYANSMQFDFSPYLDQMDIVFIDGGHHYEAAASDTRNALRMVRPGGFVLWHDFANYGDYNDVTRAALDLLPRDTVVQIENSELAVYRAPVA